MKSKTTKSFRKLFSKLPKDIQSKARESYQVFRKNPWHSSLRFKQVHTQLPIYSIRVSRGYRAVGQRTEIV